MRFILSCLSLPVFRKISFTLLPAALMLIFTISCNELKKEAGGENQPENSPAKTAVKPLKTVRLLPYWVTSAQFAGYYIGIEKGIFKKHGISLEMLPFEPFADNAALISSKKADFALLWLVNALKIKSQGVDIVNIAQLSYKSSLMLITKKSSGINSLQAMNGKRAGIWIGYELQPKALFRKFNLDVSIVPIGSTNTLFLLDGVQIINANWFDEYHSMINNGYNENELNTFFFADYGLNFLEDGLYCLSEKARLDPELCHEFVKATLESWYYAFSHQEETIEVVVKYAQQRNQPVNISHQRWMLKHYQSLYIPKGKSEINTVLFRKDYETVLQIMIDSKLISKPVSYESFYNPCRMSGSRK